MYFLLKDHTRQRSSFTFIIDAPFTVSHTQNKTKQQKGSSSFWFTYMAYLKVSLSPDHLDQKSWTYLQFLPPLSHLVSPKYSQSALSSPSNIGHFCSNRYNPNLILPQADRTDLTSHPWGYCRKAQLWAVPLSFINLQSWDPKASHNPVHYIANLTCGLSAFKYFSSPNSI